MDDDDKVAADIYDPLGAHGRRHPNESGSNPGRPPSLQVADTRVTQPAAGGSAQPSPPPRPRAPATDNDLDFDLSPARAAPAVRQRLCGKRSRLPRLRSPRQRTLATAPVLPPQRDVGIAAAGPKAPSIATAPAPASSAAEAKPSSTVTPPAAAPSRQDPLPFARLPRRKLRLSHRRPRSARRWPAAGNGPGPSNQLPPRGFHAAVP